MPVADLLSWNDAFIPKIAASAGVSYITSDYLAKQIWDFVKKLPDDNLTKQFMKRYSPHHAELGTSLITMGVLGYGRSFSPLALGAGTGLIFSDLKDWINQEDRTVRTIFSGQVFPHRDIAQCLGKYKDTLENSDLHEIKIPDWMGRRHRYNVVSKTLRSMINDWTFNRKRQEWIPPAKMHPIVVAQARKILYEKGIDGRDHWAAGKAIQDWMQQNIGYVNDPSYVDWYLHPYLLLDLKSGDCDEHATLSASLAEALDIPARMVMISQHDPEYFNHIFTELKMPDGKWYSIESTKPVGFGYKAAHVLRRGVINI